MGVVAHHALLALSVAALAGAALRIASLAAPRGLERAVAAAVIAATAAGLEALGLGLVRLGTDTVALGAAAALTWVGARALLPAPAVGVPEELRGAWEKASLPERVAFGAAAGALLAWAAWQLRYPALGIDSVAYHLPEVVGWIHDGSPGAVEPIFAGLPVGNYPLTNEVLLAWGMGIGRSFVFAGLWSPATMLLLAAAGWGSLRRLDVPPPAAGLAIAALCATPVLTHYQMNGASTDMPALAWLVSAGFLTLAAARRPALLAPGLLAAALAVGTKTTTLPLAALVVALGLWRGRGELRGLARPLALAAAAGVAVGGYWYLRNLVDHGSPFWPFLRASWSDPLPDTTGVKEGLEASFLDRPGTTIDRIGDDWLRLFGGGFLMLGGALVAPLVARSRAVTAAAVATGVSVLIWMNSPFTGASVRSFEVATISTIRYLLPALAAGILTLSLAAASPRRVPRVLGLLALATGLALSVIQTDDLGFPSVPSVWTPLAGAALGAAVALVVSRLRLSIPAPGTVAAAIICLGAGALLSPAASGYVERHGSTAHLFGSDMVRWFADQPSFRDGDRPVAGAPIVLGPLAGDRLQHRFEWLRGRQRCSRVRSRAQAGWVVVLVSPRPEDPPSKSLRCFHGVRPAFRGLGFTVFRR